MFVTDLLNENWANPDLKISSFAAHVIGKTPMSLPISMHLSNNLFNTHDYDTTK